MKITISVPSTTAGAPPSVRVLGDDAVRAFITGWAPEASAIVQTGRYPRATQVTKFARGNIETVMSFITQRTHATRAAALLFIAHEVVELPNLRGTVVVNEIGGSNASIQLENALIAGCRVVNEVHGVETIIAYRIEGGAFNLNSTS